MPSIGTWDSAHAQPRPQQQQPPPTPPQLSRTNSSDNKKNVFLHLTETNIHATGRCPCVTPDNSDVGQFRRRQSQQSHLAKLAMQSNTSHAQHELLQRRQSDDSPDEKDYEQLRTQLDQTLSHNSSLSNAGSKHARTEEPAFKVPSTQQLVAPRSFAAALNGRIPEVTGATMALNDTPAPSAPNSPHLHGARTSNPSTLDAAVNLNIGIPMKPGSGSSTPRVRPTTLDIPGLTKSKVSPDGRIAQRDVGAKLVIVMVGLPARGKSYITKKLARYLNWLQHDTKIFNVGERRRVAAGGPLSPERGARGGKQGSYGFSKAVPPAFVDHLNLGSPGGVSGPVSVAQILLNGDTKLEPPSSPLSIIQTSGPPLQTNGHAWAEDSLALLENDLYRPDMGEPGSPGLSRKSTKGQDAIEQDAAFFDPENQSASQIREQLAVETLDELLDYILEGNGSVGILDATNSTLERRKMVMDRIRARAGPDLNVLFLESRCVDKDLLEANMRLKLSGPDYKDTDPTIALADFRKRVEAYEKAYVPLGEYEERHNMPYIQMIDVGRKIISHQIKGFLMAQANYYLLNFNLAPRQIWITRHGLSVDNISGKIGGDSDLAPEGHQYAKSLVRFMDEMRKEWNVKQMRAVERSHFPPQPGDVTPPNPHWAVHASCPTPTSSAASTTSEPLEEVEEEEEEEARPPFCVWTSMLQRSIQTAQYFNDEEYDVKQMRMLDELNAGVMEGLTYNCISTQHPEEYATRKRDKLHYRYPGPGGEGYLDIINRLRPVIVELERMTDHVLLIGHRSVARVLLAYFKGLKREEVADLDVPIGMLYCLEPKPYGVDFRAYKWSKEEEWFLEQPDFKLKTVPDEML